MTGRLEGQDGQGREIRHFRLPASPGGKIRVWRYLLLRRATQILVLLLLFGTYHWGWEAGGAPLLRGNLSAAELLGRVPLADPFATLQIVATGRIPDSRILIGAALVLLFYAVAGGRTFCSWVCPVNPVTDLAGWLRSRWAFGATLRVTRALRYWFLSLALVLSVLTGMAAFEWISPIGMLHRELIFGMGLGWVAVLGLFLFDLVILRDGWCGHLCPLGAFYALVGRAALVRVRFDESTCTRCGDCFRFCPEPQVLDLARAAEAGMIASGECTNCGRCTPICPEGSLRFGWRRSAGLSGNEPTGSTVRSAR